MGYWDNPSTGSLDLREKTGEKHIKTLFFLPVPHTGITKRLSNI